MKSFEFNHKEGSGLQILCIGAHCDDIEIGCGGTVLKLIGDQRVARIHWIVFCSTPERKKEAEKSASLFLNNTDHLVTIHDFKDGYTPHQWSRVKDHFEKLKETEDPDLIFTHTRDDRHQDHRTIHNLTWNTFRNHTILEYEIPKYDGDLGTPNVFIPIEKKILDRRNRILKDCFISQLGKQWFDEELLNSLPRVRGVECASDTKFAEAFYGRKIVL